MAIHSFYSSNIFIVLAWTFISCCSQELTDFLPGSKKESSSNQSEKFILFYATFSISCPIASLLAEVFIGRYKFISYTLRAQWLISVAGSVILAGEYYLQSTASSVSQVITYYLLEIPAVAFESAIIAVVGLDQMAGGSGTNITTI